MTHDYQHVNLWRWLLVGWLRLIWFLRRNFGIRAYGIGFMAARVKSPFVFSFRGARFRFHPPAARSYCLLPAGIPNEPETHQFLDRVLRGQSGVTFVDVGASIGEFAIPMGADDRVSRVIAFEPHPVTCEALRRSVDLQPRDTVRVIESGVCSRLGFADFGTRDDAPTSAGLVVASDEGKLSVPVCTIDDSLEIIAGTPVILLMDIEGGELEATKGATRFLAQHKPLLIFEYNETTRRHFGLGEMTSLLGEAYTLHRLRSADGLLDEDLSNTWNVVALPNAGPWAPLNGVAELFAR